MKWNKLGPVFDCTIMPSWSTNSALTPTPFLLDNNTIRVFCSFRDEIGVGQIGYVDVSASDPTKIIKVGADLSLPKGKKGRFDDNGLILGDVIRTPNGQIRMYYVGFQKVANVKFLAFSGVALSSDATKFTRYSEAPIMDRCNNAHCIRAIHSVIFENGVYKVWYAVGDDWQNINGKNYPKYNIWYTESVDGFTFNREAKLCVDVSAEEYRIGRPSVVKRGKQYVMFYTKGSVHGKDYFPGVAYSNDGIEWERRDDLLGLSLGKYNDFDSKHLSYPRLVKVKDKWYAFYNGNDMGLHGFGVAELLSW